MRETIGNYGSFLRNSYTKFKEVIVYFCIVKVKLNK